MKVVRGRLNYTDSQPDVVRIFTGNPVIKRNGAIVMGAGAAKQVRDTYPGIDVEYGTLLRQNHGAHLMFVSTPNGSIGWLKVKHHWQNDADLDLVAKSVQVLSDAARGNPHTKFAVNMPAVGNGRCSIDDVMPLVQTLPSNVTVYW